MNDRTEEIMALYEEATHHFKKAVLMFFLSIAASFGAIFMLWRS